MNAKQLQYAVILAQERSFSQAAERLKTTQPAYSKQILSLEKELGVSLFDRSTVPLSMTPAGERFVAQARDILDREEKLRKSMAQYRSGEYGRLTIGLSPFRCAYLIADTVKALQQRYPNLQIILREAGSEELHKAAVEGQNDITIMNLPVDETILNVYPLHPESIVLVVPGDLQHMLPASKADPEYPYPVIDLGECMDIPFVVLGKQQELRHLFDNLCDLSGLAPKICTEVVGITTAFAMVLAGVGATILPLPVLLNGREDRQLRYYSLKHCSFTRKPVVAVRKDVQLSEYARYAIELLAKKADGTENQQ